MNELELGHILKEMYHKAPEGYKAANIHLFGVKYASIILANHLSVNGIISAAGLSASYKTELSKGIKLSEYVVPKS